MITLFPQDDIPFQYFEWTVKIERVIINYLALLLLVSVKSHVLFTVYYLEPDLNNALFICLWVFLQCSSQQYLNALQT